MSRCYLPYHEFERCARELVTISDKLGDGWELKTVKIYSEPEKIYLSKTTSECTLSSETSDAIDGDTLTDLVGCGGALEPTDIATVNSPPMNVITVEYHIVYSVSYEVPILYFIATHTNGSQLQLEDIWKIVSKDLTSTSTDRWSLVSQQDHPLLGRPYYHVHPCHTAKVMGQANDLSQGASNYLISWLSVFGPIIGLKVPINYIHT